jgi:osmotically-inducible protein OsmY
MSYQDRDRYRRDRMDENRRRFGEQRSAYGRDYGYTGDDWESDRNRSMYSQRSGSQADNDRDFGGYDRAQGMSGRSESGSQPVTWTYTEVWLNPGPYSGRGPKDYRRSDERIKEDVCERLTQHGQLDAGDIEVDVSGGEVTLKGSVDSRQAKRMAEDSIESISGIKDVHNQLRIKRDEENQQTRHDRQSQELARERGA